MVPIGFFRFEFGVSPLRQALVAQWFLFFLFFPLFIASRQCWFGPFAPRAAVVSFFFLNLVRVRCWSSVWRWFWPFAFILGFGCVRWFRFSLLCVRRHVLVDPRGKVPKDQT